MMWGGGGGGGGGGGWGGRVGACISLIIMAKRELHCGSLSEVGSRHRLRSRPLSSPPSIK